MFYTPILFLIFNRPEITQRVFEEIRKQKPKFLFIAADGPRQDNKQDVEKCQVTRNLVVKGIDWDCEVKTLFRDKNLGCGIAVSEAITWFFNNVEQGIILEDDCMPHFSFFGYCETLLEKYKNNENVYGISGNNFQNGLLRGDASYFFSNYSHIWGWASWKRAWKYYDFNLENLEGFEKSKIINKIDKRKTFKNYWILIFKKTAIKEIDTWDYQWLFTIWYNRGIMIAPNVNLISNIGFGKQATHTTLVSPFANMITQNIGKISHPKNTKINKKADRYTSNKVYNIPTRTKSNFEYLKKLVIRIYLKIK